VMRRRQEGEHLSTPADPGCYLAGGDPPDPGASS
jgi:hypothetical protein